MEAKGFTIIEVLIATFVIGTVVVGLAGLFVLSFYSAQSGERRIVGVALANEKMEQVRNLSYAQVGTVGGVPAGAILQSETVVRNDMSYQVTTDIRYVDDPYDGESVGTVLNEHQVVICHKPGTVHEHTLTVGTPALDAHLAHGDTEGPCEGDEDDPPASDEYNADYKQVRVAVAWEERYSARPVVLITYVSPPGIESSLEGGTLDFHVINANGDSVEGATVELVNSVVSPEVNLNTQTNIEGRLVLPGLIPDSGSYELTVNKAGYTNEQTYDSTASFFPDTEHQHLSILLQKITEKTFVIDEYSSINVSTQTEEGDPLPDIGYHIIGTKSIGTDDASSTVYKLDENAATDASAANSHTNLEWDQYDLTVDGETIGYDIKEASVPLPLSLPPATDLELTLVFVEHTPLTVQVAILSPDSIPIDNATVTITSPAGTEFSHDTGVWGQVFFSDLPESGDYDVSIDAPGYEHTDTVVNVSSNERLTVDMVSVSE